MSENEREQGNATINGVISYIVMSCSRTGTQLVTHKTTDQAVDQCTITSDDVGRAMDISNVNDDVIDSTYVNDHNKTTNYEHTSNSGHNNYNSFNKKW